MPCSLVDSLPPSSWKKMETAGSFKMLVAIYQNTQHSNISEDDNLNIHHCEKNSLLNLLVISNIAEIYNGVADSEFCRMLL
jgi:hypothetical protein